MTLNIKKSKNNDDVLPFKLNLRIDLVVVCSSWVELFAATW